MTIEQEVKTARQTIIKDSFDMSIGEIIRIYERNEFLINPAYQRLRRWNDGQKTRFLESILLGIPIPPIFVFADELGRWELVDGLQRLSTIFQYAGVLRNSKDELVEKFVPSGTKALPSLNQLMWESDDEKDAVLSFPLRLSMERVRMRVEILAQGSDPSTKYDLFQRLNTGGTKLSPQEARNSAAAMLNEELYDMLARLSEYFSFLNTIEITEHAKKEQKPIELVL